MEADGNLKHVDFYTYCQTCKHKNLKEEDVPCRYCLAVPARENSEKPELWEEK